MFRANPEVSLIVFGAASAAYAWSLGMVGPAGPESGLFPFIASIIVSGAGIVLLLRPATHSSHA